MFRPSASPFDELAEALPRQLAPELSAADRAKFIDYSKEKLPAGGEALRTAIAALISSTAQAAEVEASCAAEEETARQKAEEERSKRRRAYVLAAASCGVAVVLGLLAMFANAEKHNAQTALARSTAQEGTLRTSAPTSGWPAIRSEWIVDAK